MLTLLTMCLIIGLSAGLMSGMFGIGSGSIRTPLLYFTGLPLLSACGINLLVIPFSSFVGAISHRQNIDWKFTPHMVIGGTFGSITGAFLTGIIPTLFLTIIFVIVSIITVWESIWIGSLLILLRKLGQMRRLLSVEHFF